jgi:integrase
MWPVKGRKNMWVVGFYERPRLRKWKRVRGDKATAERIQRHLQSEADLRRQGVVNPTVRRAAEQELRPLTKHIDEFVDHIDARGRAPRYIQQIRARLERFVDFAGIERLSDITAERVDGFVLDLRAAKQSPFTINEYVGTLKSFTKWAVLTARMLADPLAATRKADGRKIARKRPRRALKPEDLGALLLAARERPVHELRLIRHGPRKGQLSDKIRTDVLDRARDLGQERALAYLIASWTGLRRGELAALEWQDIDLDTLPPKIRLRASTTKSKRADTIVLHPQVAEALRQAKPDDAEPTWQVLGAVPDMKALKADLKFAGIKFETEAGRADLHAMRKSLATFLACNAVPQRIAQSHLRHTDPRLTAVTYTDESLLPTASILTALPWLPTTPAPLPQAADASARA